jgi:catechol 2,3-dioxygenase-like lactoylglutathione lyase family enzyme
MYAPPPRLNLLVIRSPNIDRAARFYSALGLLMTKHAHADGPEHYTSQVDRCVFEIYPLKTGTQPTTGTRLGFLVDAVDQLVPLVLELGAEIVEPPHDSEWGRRAVVRDLDGHAVELTTPAIGTELR